jgi:hypothetical protein
MVAAQTGIGFNAWQAAEFEANRRWNGKAWCLANPDLP